MFIGEETGFIFMINDRQLILKYFNEYLAIKEFLTKEVVTDGELDEDEIKDLAMTIVAAESIKLENGKEIVQHYGKRH